MKSSVERQRFVKQLLWRSAMYLCTGLTCLILIFLIGYVLVQGVKGLSLHFITSKPSYLTGNIGILPDIVNTVLVLLVSIIVLLPLGVGAAVYLSEYARNYRLVKLIDYAGAETLSLSLPGKRTYSAAMRRRASVMSA